MTLSLFFDEGPGRGLGHRRRMEALAAALPDGLGARLAPLDAPVNSSGPVIVDSYAVRADDRRWFPHAAPVIAVEDLVRDLDVDLLVDPSPRAAAAEYPKASMVLAGPAYALLDPVFATLTPRSVGDEVAFGLVTTGGADSEGIGASIAAALTQSLPQTTIRLVVGPWGSGRVPSRVEAVRQPVNLGALLAEADLVITSGGVTMLESLCLGRPTVAVLSSDNQRRYVEGAAHLGAVVQACPEDAANLATDLAADPLRRQALANAGAALVDGHGAERVAGAIRELL